MAPPKEPEKTARRSRFENFVNLRAHATMRVNYNQAVEGLGRICVEFQRLETILKTATASLVHPNDPTVGAIVTAQLSFRALLDLYYALHHHRYDNALADKELDKFLGQCAKAEERRNQIIHSYWAPDYLGGKGAKRTKFTAKNRKELKQQVEVLSKADLEKIADELRALHITFHQNWTERAAKGISPHAPEPPSSSINKQ
jgi:hypothetical protein